MEPPVGFDSKKHYYDAIIELNGRKRIIKALTELQHNKLPLEKKLENIIVLKQVGLVFGSQIWSGLEEEEFIVYSGNILTGVKELFKITGFGKTISSVSSYLKLNDYCKKIQDEFGFEDMSELHYFLWLGERFNWNFRIIE